MTSTLRYLLHFFLGDRVVYTVADATSKQAELNENICKPSDMSKGWHMQINCARAFSFTAATKKESLTSDYLTASNNLERRNGARYFSLAITPNSK